MLPVLHVGAEGKTDTEALATAQERVLGSGAVKSPELLPQIHHLLPRCSCCWYRVALLPLFPPTRPSNCPNRLSAETQLKASTERKEGYLSSLKVSRMGIKSVLGEVKRRGGEGPGPSPVKQRLQRVRRRARPVKAGLRAPPPLPLRLISGTG